MSFICGKCGKEATGDSCSNCDSVFLNDSATKGTYVIIANPKSVAIECSFLTDKETWKSLSIERILNKFPEFEKREPSIATLDEEQPLYSVREVWDLTVDYKYTPELKQLAKEFNYEQRYSILSKFLTLLSKSFK